MVNIKGRNVLFSLAILLICVGLIRRFSADEMGQYAWLKMGGVAIEVGAACLFVLRLVRAVNPERNFPYCFFGMANLLLGLFGVVSWFAGKMNTPGLHGLLINLLIGVIMLSDIFLFRVLTGNRDS